MSGLKRNIDIPVISLVFSLLFFIIQLFTALNYPVFRDEFYYIDCANHPAFGYVDHPPLSIWILMVWKFIFGDSQISLRIIPALCGSLLILLTAKIAKAMGGNKLSQIFASVTVFSGLYFWAVGGFYSMNAFDAVFWALLFLLLIKIINTSAAIRSENGITGHTGSIKTYWIVFGITAGLGLMNKISVGYLGLGILIAILLTGNRKWLKQKHIWIGGAIAVAVFIPYVIWNILNDFPMLEFIRNAQKYKIAVISPLDFMKEQILIINPLSAPVWIAGIAALLFTKRLKNFRVIGITYLAILLLLILIRSKPYYLAAVYPVLIAAGAVYFNTEQNRRVVNALLYIYLLFIIGSAVILSPYTIPVLPPEEAAAHIMSLGIMPSSGENNRQSGLPQILADRFGWEELTGKVAAIYNSLPDAEKNETVIFATNYGEAGAINYYGGKFGLPKCFSGHNNHYFWKPPDTPVTTVITIGWDKQDLLDTFNEAELMDSTYHPFAMPFENNVHIYLCRGLKKPIREIFELVKFYI